MAQTGTSKPRLNPMAPNFEPKLASLTPAAPAVMRWKVPSHKFSLQVQPYLHNALVGHQIIRPSHPAPDARIPQGQGGPLLLSESNTTAESSTDATMASQFPPPSGQKEATTLAKDTGVTYHTAGTLWNKNSTPIPPPNRRGRKQHQYIPLDLNIRQMIGDTSNFSPGSLRHAAISLDPQPAPQYEPLQQNYDRASIPTGSPNKKGSQDFLKPEPGMPRFPSTTAEHGATSSQNDGNAQADTDSSSALLRQMGFSTLVGLARFENKYQKEAQAAIREAQEAGRRVGAVPLNSLMIEGSLGLMHLAALSSENMPTTESKEFYAAIIQHLDDSHKPVSGQDRPSHNPGPTTLATGPGAPRPLRAGPPGQRLFRPTLSRNDTLTSGNGSAEAGAQLLQNTPNQPHAQSNQYFGTNQYRGSNDDYYQNAIEEVRQNRFK